ncbi:MAG: putative metal-binding motif-containing protein [Rhodanobacteraceae bacterium]|nr:putative metal-binding motif-containing protein [Rhodanobacteraceae bacterium]
MKAREKIQMRLFQARSLVKHLLALACTLSLVLMQVSTSGLALAQAMSKATIQVCAESRAERLDSQGNPIAGTTTFVLDNNPGTIEKHIPVGRVPVPPVVLRVSQGGSIPDGAQSLRVTATVLNGPSDAAMTAEIFRCSSNSPNAAYYDDLFVNGRSLLAPQNGTKRAYLIMARELSGGVLETLANVPTGPESTPVTYRARRLSPDAPILADGKVSAGSYVLTIRAWRDSGAAPSVIDVSVGNAAVGTITVNQTTFIDGVYTLNVTVAGNEGQSIKLASRAGSGIARIHSLLLNGSTSAPLPSDACGGGLNIVVADTADPKPLAVTWTNFGHSVTPGITAAQKRGNGLVRTNWCATYTPPSATCAAEVCNGVDDDCDGQIDEGLAACRKLPVIAPNGWPFGNVPHGATTIQVGPSAPITPPNPFNQPPIAVDPRRGQ